MSRLFILACPGTRSSPATSECLTLGPETETVKLPQTEAHFHGADYNEIRSMLNLAHLISPIYNVTVLCYILFRGEKDGARINFQKRPA